MFRSARDWTRFLCLALLAGSTLLAPIETQAADHRDGPLISNSAQFTGNLDLNDLFLFVSPTNPDNSVLILTTGGNGVGFITPPVFNPGSVYEFRIDNSSPADSVDDLIFTFIFSNPDASLRQSYAMYVNDTRRNTFTFVASGVTTVGSGTASKVPSYPIAGGGKVTAGLFDDPFFFDSLAFPIFTMVVDRKNAAGVPTPGSLAERTSAFTGVAFPSSPISTIQTARFPVNGFGNSNTLAIVVEIPRLRIQSSRANSKVSVWIRSLTPQLQQFDRTAIPAVNTTIVPPPTASAPIVPGVYITPGFGFQEMFNIVSNPQLDPIFRPIVSERIQFAYGASAATATALANTLLPDVMPFDTTNATQGFNSGLTLTLNGRKLADDVVDAELNALTEGKLTTDRVRNDSVFLGSFPFLGPPQPLHLVLQAAAARSESEK